MDQRRCAGCMAVTDGPFCQHCGWPADKNNEPHQLPVGTVLRGQYMVGRVLGQGGFGITYLGWDAYLEAPVAIKEYYPSFMVTRDHSTTRYVRCYTAQIREQYAASKARFLREARTLAKFQDEPAVVHIRSCFEENDTAYIIMEYLHGETLADRIRRTGPMKAEGLLELLRPVMEALEDVHQAHIVHRDISPDNIMILPDGRAKLLDFGAARDSSNGNTTETVVKHGFAPFEQYQNKGDLGPWTDVYALCATLWYCFTGRIPTEALTRVTEGEAMGWDQIPGLTGEQCRALEQGMAIRHKERTKSVAQLMQGLLTAEKDPEELRAKVEARLRQELRPQIEQELRRELRPLIEQELKREQAARMPMPEPPAVWQPVPEQKSAPRDQSQPAKQGPAAGRTGAVTPLTVLLIAVVLALTVGLTFLLIPKGWSQTNGGHIYRTAMGTKLVSQWYTEEGRYYYFDAKGYMVTGFTEVDGHTYYFGKTDGRMRTGWQEIDGRKYYFGENDGRMRTGLQKIDGKLYFFSENDGLAGTGWKEVDGDRYYVSESNGIVCTGWKQIDDLLYHFDENDGKMSTGAVLVNGLRYTFAGTGELIGWPSGRYPEVD